MTKANTLVQRYLDAEEHEHLDDLRALFSDHVVIRNAANPVDDAPGALERFALSFWDRTEHRSFVLIDTATTGNTVFALAEATMRFRQGVAFGPVTAGEAFTVTLPVAMRLQLDDDGLISELDIHHETTTAVQLAANSTTVA